MHKRLLQGGLWYRVFYFGPWFRSPGNSAAGSRLHSKNYGNIALFFPFLFWRNSTNEKEAGKMANSKSNSSSCIIQNAFSTRRPWRGKSSLRGWLQQPRIFLFKRLKRDAKLMDQRQITIKMISLSDSSQHEANAPSWQILQVSYCPETCYFIVLAKHNKCYY